MYVKSEKKRFSLWLPVKLHERLEHDSAQYGIPKCLIVQNALINYYRTVDSANTKNKVL